MLEQLRQALLVAQAYLATLAPTTSRRLYLSGKAHLGQHLTLDDTVPAMYGCAQAISYLLYDIHLPMYMTGISDTRGLKVWLDHNGKRVTTPSPGCVIISPSTDATHGHVGVFGIYGILSNNSLTGLLGENYTYESWVKRYHEQLGLDVLIYQLY